MSYPMTDQLGVNIIPGQKWGTYKFPSGEVVKLEEVADQVMYDSEVLPTVVAAGTEYRMMNNPNFAIAALGPKTPRHDFNMPEWGRVPVGWLYRIRAIGFRVQAGEFSRTVMDIANDVFMQFFTGGQTVEVEGLLIDFPTGSGLGGAVALDGGGVANEVSALNIGPPSVAQTVPMVYPIDLPEQVSFQVNLFCPIGLNIIADAALIARYGAVIGAGLGAQLYAYMRMIRYRIVR
jgi:hypothetical protein